MNVQGAGDTLQYFGQRRTDLNVSKQFQGVETYSQVNMSKYHTAKGRLEKTPMRYSGFLGFLGVYKLHLGHFLTALSA